MQSRVFDNLIDVHTGQTIRVNVPDDYSYQDMTEVGASSRWRISRLDQLTRVKHERMANVFGRGNS